MRQCLKYNGAKAPAINSQEEFDILATWTFNTTQDTKTGEQYPDTLSEAFWVPFS